MKLKHNELVALYKRAASEANEAYNREAEASPFDQSYSAENMADEVFIRIVNDHLGTLVFSRYTNLFNFLVECQIHGLMKGCSAQFWDEDADSFTKEALSLFRKTSLF